MRGRNVCFSKVLLRYEGLSQYVLDTSSMHIKEVTLSGFRSYRQTTIEDFSPRHNVVVGRNGSGKSNFFFGVQFVLSDEFAHLRGDQREGFIHEGVGERVCSARVEVVFDNTDRRIITMETDEVRVMRQVSLKKDQYFVNSKIVARSDVVSMMESAGFSRSNPYHIVKQGKINELAVASDAFRLKLLCEVAGTRVFDERKDESLKILRETSSKSEKIEALLGYISSRLSTLESEKESLKEYQKLDKVKRSVEYTVYNNQASESLKKLSKLAEQREDLNARQNEVAQNLLGAQSRLAEISADQRKLDERIKRLKEEKEGLLAERTERVQRQTEAELRASDLKEELEKERAAKDGAEKELENLRENIAAKEVELGAIARKYAALLEREAALTTDIRIVEQRCKEIYAKQGYREQYKTAKERDKALSKEIRFYDRQLEEVQEQLTEIEKNLSSEAEDEEQLTRRVVEVGLYMDECFTRMSKVSEEVTDLRQKLEQSIMLQQEAAREEKNARNELDALKGDLSRAEQFMRTLSPRAVVVGVDSVRRVLEYFRENNEGGANDFVLSGYRGLLIDLLHCDDVYFQAVEVTAGNRLFFHVVDDDLIALKIIKEVNRQRLMGEVNFFPLNRVTAKPMRPVNDPDARLLVDSLEFDAKYEVVFRTVFGDTAVVRNLLVGNRVAKGERFNCVTLEGDQVLKRGPMTGGFLDAKRSRLAMHSSIQKMLERKLQAEGTLEAAIRKNNEGATAVEKICMQRDARERDVVSLKNDYKSSAEKKRDLSHQLQQFTKNREPKMAQCIFLRGRVRELEASRALLQTHIGAPLLSQLTDEERRELDKLQNDVKGLKEQLDTVTHERSQLESLKFRIENHLTTNLIHKQESLDAKVHDISIEEKHHIYQAELLELRSLNARLAEIDTKLNELEQHLAECEETQMKQRRESEKWQEKQRKLEAEMIEFSKQIEVLRAKQSTAEARREETLNNIRAVGSLPTDVKKYENYSTKELMKTLDETLAKLAKYADVNKKALEQFQQASAQRDELRRRADKHTASQQCVHDLLSVLEQRRHESVKLTLKIVSKNFEEIFAKLVPGGEGSLVMRSSPGTETPDSDLPSDADLVGAYTGVAIKVSFAGSSEGRYIQQLSGGQKSVVALALIFAIQKCDPAPFYLFDEIDAALDPQYRGAVAEMIHELSKSAQFITTTFRAELLDSADKYFGVRFRNKVSHIDPITAEQAKDFVEDEEVHG